MAWDKNYKKKRYYKKKKNPLNKQNIFKYKSAVKQAKQIYSLVKRVNGIEKKTRPETIIQECPFFNTLFTTDGNPGSYGLKEYHTRFYLYETFLFGENGCNYQMNGDILRPYNITISGIFENKNHNAEVDGKVYNVPLTGYLRIIVCRLWGGNQARYPFQITKSYGDVPDIGLINGPLINDVSASMKIIKNKVIKIDSQKDTKMFKIKIKNPGTYRKGVDMGGTPPAYQNEYLVYIQYFAPDQFFADGYGGTQPVAPIQRVSSGIKFAFTDN